MIPYTPFPRAVLVALVFLALVSRQAKSDEPQADLWSHDHLNAWCVACFDSKKRGPEDRAAMLQNLGFKGFVYDWQPVRPRAFEEEIEALQKHHIEMPGWWFPTNSNDPDCKLCLETFKHHQLHPQLWVMGSGEFTRTPREQAARIQQEADRIEALVKLAEPYGCRVELYNHNGWFGSEDNELAIIDELKKRGITSVGMVYNFSHSIDADHDDSVDFPDLWKRMQPHVVAVNLTGLGPDGLNVYLSQGVHEIDMMHTIQQSGWHGAVGLIAEHGGDAEITLSNFIKGLDWCAAELKQPGSGGPKPVFPSSGIAANADSAPASGHLSAPGHTEPASDMTLGGVEITNHDELRTFPITVEGWARFHDATRYNVFAVCDPKTSSNNWCIYSDSGSGFLGVYLPGRGLTLSSSNSICDDNWHYLAVTFGKDEVRAYVDGKMVIQHAYGPPTGSPDPGNIGIGKTVGPTDGNLDCNGLIQDVRISKGIRDVSHIPAAPFTRDDQTLELWPLGAGAPVPGSASSSFAPAHPGGNTDTTNAELEAKVAAVNLTTTAAQYANPPADLPKYKTIPAATKEERTPSNGWPASDSFKQWTRSNGGPTGARYSALTEINKQNVGRLQEAWTYHSKDGAENIQCNPIIVDGVVFLPTAGNCVAAVDGTKGTEIWRFKAEVKTAGLLGAPARRGLIYWPGDAGNRPRIFFTMGPNLFAIDPQEGHPIPGFGDNGRASMPLEGQGCSVAPVVYKHTIILPGFTSNIYGFDVITGAPVWTFDTQASGTQPESDTWSSRARGGADVWGGIALDESRGIAYITTSSPHPNFMGVGTGGDNLFSDCIIALNAETGRYLWHFQEVRHDIWDFDIPAPPVLVTVTQNGVKIDAVAATTKIGNTILLDRVTGRPLFPFRLRRAPDFKLPGLYGSPYQPDLELPEPFVRQEFTMDDITDLSPEAHEAVKKTVEQSNLGWFAPFEDGKSNIYFAILGGSEWVGAAAAPEGRLYVTASEMPWIEGLYAVGSQPHAPMSPAAIAGENVFQVNCAACHGTNHAGAGMAPSLIGLNRRLTEAAMRTIFKQGRNSMPPQPQLSEDQVKQLIALLLDNGAPSDGNSPVNGDPSRYADMGYTRLVDPQNYPGCKPPWGSLSCIDLNTGKIAWKVPLGEYPELTAKGIPKTGTENMAGATVTAGGVVFAGGTRDNQFRAFDADTGVELWKYNLPLHSTAPAAIYEAGGHEYVVLPVTGGGKLGGAVGGGWMSFALPTH